jgi:hypothetical protein
MENKIGIWMDSDKAHIIHNESGSVNTILSELEHYHLGGGARAKTPYGTQNASSETKLEERKKNQLKKYFDNINNHITDVNDIVVFGPGETKIAYKKVVEDHPILKGKLRAVETASNTLTENQLKEWVRNFYAR